MGPVNVNTEALLREEAGRRRLFLAPRRLGGRAQLHDLDETVTHFLMAGVAVLFDMYAASAQLPPLAAKYIFWKRSPTSRIGIANFGRADLK
jgi:hypothetical protein